MGAQAIKVLKFGSSVLAAKRDLGRAVHEIYRELREGVRVVAVVSALGRTTNRLLDGARRIHSRPGAALLARLLATGEAQSVALLCMALERAGVSTRTFDPSQIGLLTRGPLLDAEPIGLDTQLLRDALRESSVVVLPGFVGRDEHGNTTLLGRGGSDLSALFIAQRLRAGCRLVKDVAGVYDRDPATYGSAARRYSVLDRDDALAISKRVVQEKALRFARENRLEFEVGAINSTRSTTVGGGPSRFASSSQGPRRLRVVLLGLGTVGLGVYRELARFPDLFDVQKILVRRAKIGRPAKIPLELITTDVESLRIAECDVVVEVLGGREPAGELIEASLVNGVDVVSANKGLVVERRGEFLALAAKSGARFLCSASVCGALPALELVRRVARERRIAAIEGILNSTTNVVLDLLARGQSLEAALARAKRQGFCERDPGEDLDGTDAAHKLTLIAREAFGEDLGLHWVEREGIAILDPAQVHAAALAGQSVRLVAACRRTKSGAELRLSPRWLASDQTLATVRAEENAVVIHTDDGERIVLRGKGAGRWPTTQSVVGDLLELSRLCERDSSSLDAVQSAAAI